MAEAMEAKIDEMHEFLVATRTHKVGSNADRKDYDDVFRILPARLTTDEESNTLLHWNWDQFVSYRSEVVKLLMEHVPDLVEVYNRAGFEAKDLQPVLSAILLGAVELVQLPEMDELTIETNLPFAETKIIVADTSYSYHGNGDVSVVIAEGGVRVGLGGAEAKRGGKFFLTANKQQLSADAVKACAQCAAQILGYSTVYEAVYGRCRAFIQLVVNGREWMLVCSTRAGYRRRMYRHTQPVALFSLDTAGKATARPATDACYNEVAHMIAVMMDCTCSLLHGRQIQSLGAQLKEALVIEGDDEEEDEEDEDMEDADSNRSVKAPPLTKNKGAKGSTDRKRRGTSTGRDVVRKYGLTEENIAVHDMHFGLPRGGLVGVH